MQCGNATHRTSCHGVWTDHMESSHHWKQCVSFSTWHKLHCNKDRCTWVPCKFFLQNCLCHWLGQKNKSYVLKLPRAFVFRCVFVSAKSKVWIFFACLFFFQFFMNLLVKIYKKRYDRHNETIWTTDFFNSVFCLVSCSSKIKFHISKLWPTQIWHVFCSEKKKKPAFRSGLPICHKLWDIAFIFFFSLTKQWTYWVILPSQFQRRV